MSLLKRKNKKTGSADTHDSLLRKLLQGRLVSGTFFARHWLKVFFVIAMILVYITNRYSSQRSMEEIKMLNNRLAVVQSESIRVRGEYMSMIRESDLTRRVNQMGLNLSVQSRPPYHLDY